MNIYTDGGCDRNGQADAVGAWAIVASDGHEDCGAVRGTTSNRMELTAIIKAIEYAKGCGVSAVTIYTDSQITQMCAMGKWKRRANTDLWAEYEIARHGLSVTVQWVRGHSGIAGNERADELCCMALADATEEPAEVGHLRNIMAGG